MAYRRPAVTVIQEFVGLVPALAQFSLPSVSVGPAFQLVTEDFLGVYSGIQVALAYASLMGGAIVDTAFPDPNELFPITKKPISVRLANAVVEILGAQTTGSVSGQLLTDATSPTQFEDVLAGDILVITAATGVSIVSAQTNGQSTNASGLTNRLTAGTVGQFAKVKTGDSVVITGGAPSIAGTYTVVAVQTGDVLVLSGAINDGSATSSAVNFSITGDRGQANAGNYTVQQVVSATQLKLTSSFATNEAPENYSIRRNVASIPLTRLTSPGAGYVADENSVQLPASLLYVLDPDTFPILSANVLATYRALRTDMAATVMEFAKLPDLQAFFGIDQIDPANPLAFALQLMLENTVTPVNGLGLDENAISDEVQSHLNALGVLAMTEMYALCPLTQNPAIAPIYKTHVEGFSAADKRKERVAITNRLLKTIEVMQTESTTTASLSGARIIVNTSVTGAALIASATHFNDPTSGAFANVQLGDTVTIVGGTNSIPGNYTVVTKTDNNNLILSGAVVAVGNSTNLQYFIVRKDGLGADGKTFYDRNATFIANGVAAGMFLTIESGSLAGRYKIGSVTSDKQLVLAVAIPGVLSLQSAIDYQIDRNLSKTEQANFISGYSSAIGSRRVVNLWPDVLNAPVGQTVLPVPGYFGCSVIGAITTGLPTQQGFTNLSISGFLGLLHSSGYFDNDQLDIIADGGTMILAQDIAEAPLYIRHQLTTDRSAIKFQEYSVTKNVDFIAKFLRNAFKNFPGSYNIVDTTLDELRQTAKGAIVFLKDQTRLPKIGGVIRSGSLDQLAQSDTQIDTVTMRFKLDIPIPLNNLDITIQV